MARPLSAVRVHAPARALVPALLLVLSGVSLPAWSAYKVVGPDGKVTYTDRPPVDGAAQPVRGGNAGAAQPELPYALQQVVSRYPVRLFTGKNCAPCDAARDMLKTRGVPFTETTVDTPEDARAYRSQEGADKLPSVRIGSKQLTSYTQSDWSAYLDAAGYPAQSALPRTYVQPPATPMVPVADKAAPRDADAARQAPAATPAPETGGNAPPGFRF